MSNDKAETGHSSLSNKHYTAVKKRACLSLISTAPVLNETAASIKRPRIAGPPMMYQRQSFIMLSEEQRVFLHNEGRSYELELLQPNKKMDISQIVKYVQSFRETLFSTAKNKCNSISCNILDFCNANNTTVDKFIAGSNQKIAYCHIPVQIGRGPGRHIIAVTVALMKKKIIIYDPKTRHTRSSSNEKNNITNFDQYPNSNNKTNCEIRVAVGKIQESIQKRMEKLKLGLASFWRVETINEWLQQSNATDCGVFVSFFFKCVTGGMKLKLGANKKENPKEDLSRHREWIAFSLVVLRITCACVLGNREGRTIKL